MAKSKLSGSLLAAGLAAAILGPGPVFAEAAVRVTFVQPEAYTDAGDYRTRGTAATLKALQSHFEQLGARYLKPGQRLDLEILDIDLAGRFEPWRYRAYDLRVMREGTWPRIKLRYALAENGQVLAQGEEQVSDLNYLTRIDARLSNDRLPYEKAMLGDWFRARLATPRPPAS